MLRYLTSVNRHISPQDRDTLSEKNPLSGIRERERERERESLNLRIIGSKFALSNIVDRKVDGVSERGRERERELRVLLRVSKVFYSRKIFNFCSAFFGSILSSLQFVTRTIKQNDI